MPSDKNLLRKRARVRQCFKEHCAGFLSRDRESWDHPQRAQRLSVPRHDQKNPQLFGGIVSKMNHTTGARKWRTKGPAHIARLMRDTPL